MTMLVTYLLFVPFLIPLVVLAFVGVKSTLPHGVQSFAAQVRGKTWVLWLAQAVLGLSLGKAFQGQVGIILTLVVPNLFFIICYSPYFFIGGTKGKLIVIEGLMCVISTLVFWSGSVGSHNWKESGLAFVFIFPALFVMTAIATGLVFLRLNSDGAVSNIGPKRRPYKVIVISGLIILGLFVAKGIFSEEYDMREPVPKSHLLCRIAKILAADRSNLLTTQAAIAKGAFAGLYELKSGMPLNKYGGEISVRQEGDVIVVAYSGIPTVAPCTNMIFINADFAFKKVFINGEAFVPTGYNEHHDQLKNACRLGGSNVKIEFSAEKSDLIARATSCFSGQ